MVPRALWRKAPFLLFRQRSAFAAVLCSAALVAMAAAAAPLLRAGAESEILKSKLATLTPLAAGLEIETHPAPRGGNGARADRSRREAARRLGRAMRYVGAPVLTTSTFASVNRTAPGGLSLLDVVPMARTGATAHVQRLAGGGDGAWIASSVAKSADVRPGTTLPLVEFLLSGGRLRSVPVRVSAVYRPLDSDLSNPYWVNFLSRIRPRNPDSPPYPTFLFVSLAEVYRIAHAVADDELANVFEYPVAIDSMTPSRAKRVAGSFAEVRRELATSSPLARSLGCGTTPSARCDVSSSIEAGVIFANESVDALTPVISALAGLAALIALGGAFIASIFNVRRRAAEARLSTVGGESRLAFAARAALEVTVASVLGVAIGLGCAVGLVRLFAPAGTIDAGVARATIVAAAAALLASICISAAGAWVARGPSVERSRASRRIILPWEVPVLVGAAVAFVLIERGHGMVQNGAIGTHPRLVVLLAPLLAAAGVAGLAVRGARRFLRRASPRRDVTFLALRRLAAARGLVVLLVVSAAVSLCAVTFAEILRDSLRSNSVAKAYASTGGDVQGLIDPAKRLPSSFPYPIAKVAESFGPVELLAADPVALARVVRSGGSALHRLAASSAPLPAIVVGSPGTRAISVGGKVIPLDVVARPRSFPGMIAGRPLIVVPAPKLHRVTGSADPMSVALTYVWAKGDPALVERALARSSLAPQYLTTAKQFLANADLATADRAYGFLRVIALAAALITMAALLLYLHARSRSQLVAAAFLKRMGLQERQQMLSVALEGAVLVGFSSLVGVGTALLTASSIATRVDPVPQYPPSTTATVPWLLLPAAFLIVLAAAAFVGALASRVRGDVGEALRVA